MLPSVIACVMRLALTRRQESLGFSAIHFTAKRRRSPPNTAIGAAALTSDSSRQGRSPAPRHVPPARGSAADPAPCRPDASALRRPVRAAARPHRASVRSRAGRERAAGGRPVHRPDPRPSTALACGFRPARPYGRAPGPVASARQNGIAAWPHRGGSAGRSARSRAVIAAARFPERHRCARPKPATARGGASIAPWHRYSSPR